MSNSIGQREKVVSWIFQVAAAVILAWASYGKFLETEMNVYVFNVLEMGDSGRILVGIIEALAAIMLLTSNLPHLGALLGFSTMLGAMIAHFSVLGLNVQEDNGMMIGLMTVVVISTFIVMGIRRRKLPLVGITFS